MQSISRYIANPKQLILSLVVKTARFWPTCLYQRIVFFCQMGYWPDLKHPHTFNEKLQWLKLNDRRNEYTQMVDKVAAKQYVENKISKDIIIPTLGVWDKVEDIDWDSLPERFVIKCSQGNADAIIQDGSKPFDRKAASLFLNKYHHRNYFWVSREWPYKNVPHRIIAEQFICDNKGELNDYKFFCFNGKVRILKVDFDRFKNHRANYYSKDLELLPFGETVCPPDFTRIIKFPDNMVEMIAIAERLSENIPFLRVDLYNVDGHIYFGELTFYPASGNGSFVPEIWDVRLGEMLKLR